MAWLVNEGTNYLTSGEVPRRRGNEHPNIVPYGVFETADGHVIVAVGNDAQYERFCELLGAPELAEDERYRTNAGRLAHRDELVARLSRLVQELSSADVLAGLEARGVPGGPIHNLKEALASDQAEARGMTIDMPHALAGSGTVTIVANPIRMSETPVTYRRSPPVCGADTDEVIAELLGDED
jgi:crotonobetainyl-CoA:carnitine CoA-transferase CaiB-like acyl-CoA transferase